MKTRSLAQTIALYLLTGGLYGIYLLIDLGLRAFQGNKPWALRSFIGALVLLVGVFALIGPIAAAVGEGSAFRHTFSSGLTLLIGLVLVVAVYVSASILASTIARQISSQQESAGLAVRCSSARAAWLTVLGFLGAIYLQHHVNTLRSSG